MSLRVSGFLEAGRRGNGAGARTFFLKCAIFCCASEKGIFKWGGGLHGEIWGLIGDGLGRWKIFCHGFGVFWCQLKENLTGINNIYMITGFGVDLGVLWGDIGFLGWDTWFFEIFWADQVGYGGNKGSFG